MMIFTKFRNFSTQFNDEITKKRKGYILEWISDEKWINLHPDEEQQFLCIDSTSVNADL